MALDVDELDSVYRRWPGLYQLFLAAARPLLVSQIEAAALDAWQRDEISVPGSIRRPPITVDFGADYERFIDGWLSTINRIKSGRSRAATLIRRLRTTARQPRKLEHHEWEESLFESYAHLVAALDNCGFMLWCLGSILTPARFSSSPKVLKSISFKSSAQKWIEVFPAASSAHVLRTTVSDPVLGLLFTYRNLTSHRAVAPLARVVESHEVFDGKYFRWTIGPVAGGSGLLMEMGEAANFANWVEMAIDRIAAAAALVVEERLPAIEKRVAGAPTKPRDEYVRF